MVDRAKLSKALDALDTQHQLIGAIAGDRTGDWKLKLVKARRELALLLTAAASDMNALLLVPPTSSGGITAPDQEKLRSSLSRCRHALAMHQATFPVVAIEEKGGYRESAAMVQAAHEDFIQLARRLFNLAAGSNSSDVPSGGFQDDGLTCRFIWRRTVEDDLIS